MDEKSSMEGPVIEELTLGNPDKSRWRSFCGKYGSNSEQGCIDEVFPEGEDLFTAIVTDSGHRYEYRLYPLGENRFGLKPEILEMRFGGSCVIVDGETYRNCETDD